MKAARMNWAAFFVKMFELPATFILTAIKKPLRKGEV